MPKATLESAVRNAAKQIHEEFDCLSDHVLTKRQIREQITSIILRHLRRNKTTS